MRPRPRLPLLVLFRRTSLVFFLFLLWRSSHSLSVSLSIASGYAFSVCVYREWDIFFRIVIDTARQAQRRHASFRRQSAAVGGITSSQRFKSLSTNWRTLLVSSSASLIDGCFGILSSHSLCSFLHSIAELPKEAPFSKEAPIISRDLVWIDVDSRRPKNCAVDFLTRRRNSSASWNEIRPLDEL